MVQEVFKAFSPRHNDIVDADPGGGRDAETGGNIKCFLELGGWDWYGLIGTVSANGNTFQQMSGKKCVCLIGRLWKSFESGKRGPVEGIRLFSGAAKQGAGRVPIRSGLSLQWCRTGVDSLYQYLIPILPYCIKNLTILYFPYFAFE